MAHLLALATRDAKGTISVHRRVERHHASPPSDLAPSVCAAGSIQSYGPPPYLGHISPVNAVDTFLCFFPIFPPAMLTRCPAGLPGNARQSVLCRQDGEQSSANCGASGMGV